MPREVLIVGQMADFYFSKIAPSPPNDPDKLWFNRRLMTDSFQFDSEAAYVNAMSYCGGGVFGYAQALASLGANALDRVHVFAGTSVGAFPALSFAAGISPLVITGFFKTECARIFSGIGWRKIFRAALNPTFDDAALNAALQKLFGNRTCADLRRPCVITTHDALSGRPYVFWTPHHSNLELWKLARMSAAAHTYLKSFDGYLDGGLMNNSPCHALSLTLLRRCGVRFERQRIFDLGTGANIVKRTVRETQPLLKTGLLPIIFTDTVDGAGVEVHRENVRDTLHEYGGEFDHFEFPHSDFDFFDPAVVDMIDRDWQAEINTASRSIDRFFNREPKS